MFIITIFEVKTVENCFISFPPKNNWHSTIHSHYFINKTVTSRVNVKFHSQLSRKKWTTHEMQVEVSAKESSQNGSITVRFAFDLLRCFPSAMWRTTSFTRNKAKTCWFEPSSLWFLSLGLCTHSNLSAFSGGWQTNFPLSRLPPINKQILSLIKKGTKSV